jgi:hypothetical protein
MGLEQQNEERKDNMNWRYGIKQYLETPDSSVFEVIEVHEDADGDRWWSNPFVFSDSLGGVTGLMEMITNDVKDLKQPDVVTTLTEWWWADKPDVLYMIDKGE